ncbi:MAG: hypothetical protein B7X02_00110 [Rhodospirillales bacterium 12-54-5]|nr:MAG: hypothetical protein B7X02_00110 [Rhodospirillales bacterium 12-54-5]
MSSFVAAALQLNSGDDVATNIAQVEPLVREAARQKATLICLPENAFYMRREGSAAMVDVPTAQHAGVIAMQALAANLKVWIAIGSIRAREAGMEKPYNRSVLIDPFGAIFLQYDKIHLFDVTTPDGKEYRESSQAVAGSSPVLARTPFAHVGLSICYDLRFPEHYRALAMAGAEVLLVPSAFTRPTGAAHWHTLLRARAIENACYVIAAAQCGTHPGGRETYGHSLIIDPWGEIVAEASANTPGIVTATIDQARVAQVRSQIPVLSHVRPITDVVVAE